MKLLNILIVLMLIALLTGCGAKGPVDDGTDDVGTGDDVSDELGDEFGDLDDTLNEDFEGEELDDLGDDFSI